MTKGRRPLVALEEAEEIGCRRGRVFPAHCRRDDYYDLILSENHLTTFVRVKRTLSNITDSREILAQYRRDIIRLRKIPSSPVLAREIWVRSPRGNWQFFRLVADRIVEIRKDGSVFEGPEFSHAVPGVPVMGAGAPGPVPVTGRVPVAAAGLPDSSRGSIPLKKESESSVEEV